MIRFIAAAPKTGSSYIAGAVILMQTARFNPTVNYRLYPHWWKHMGNSHDWDLRPDMEQALIQNFDTTLGKGGAIYKGHFWATQKNISVLEAAMGRCLVIMRSPIDTLVAQYCSMLYEPHEALYNPIYPLAYKEAYRDVDKGIEYLVTGGYLAHLLMYYADWLDRLDDRWGIVIDYEGFIEEPAEHMAVLAQFNSHPYDIGVLRRDIEPLVEMYTKTEIDPEIYPRGWTAGRGVWKRYFNVVNLDRFTQIFQRMKAIHPGMITLDQQYPKGM